MDMYHIIIIINVATFKISIYRLMTRLMYYSDINNIHPRSLGRQTETQ